LSLELLLAGAMMIAIEAGWTVTEVGRQPRIIYGVMRTSEAVTPMPGLVVPFVTFTLLYVFLAAVVVWLLFRLEITQWREVNRLFEDPIWFNLETPVVASMAPVIPVPLDQVSGTSTSACPNQCAFPPANQSASNQTHRAANQCSLSFAVIWTTVEAPLSFHAQTSECPYYDSQQNERG
jgi:hypothetical protein